ncbi:HAD-IIIC family phosphatase [Lichenicola sp.]|uniref:HAD-IIIC family phosphatase n=1 Tax=Lichenicola sp. TaxID=2804529 RepID=UPI003AFF9B78
MRARLKAFRSGGEAPRESWAEAIAISRLRLDFTATNALDQAVVAKFRNEPPPGLNTKPVRLAILGSSTTNHLIPAIRVAALRRGIWLNVYEADYGQYFQELADTSSGLYDFQPTALLFAFDAFELAQGATAGMTPPVAAGALDDVMQKIETCWKLARDAFGCHIIQQTALDVFPSVIGENDHRLAGSRSAFITRLNDRLRQATQIAGVDLLALDRHVAQDGIFSWFNPALWYRAKQEVAPAAAPVYGDLVGRLLATKQGLSYKCLVLDLDNTLWGGVIGDDGLEGIVLGQGSATGEAYVAVQEYAREQARRGIILAVCSKNDDAIAREPFEKHPDMVLKISDIACFVANWQDKASNLRHIAERLNIGIDSLVFLDDNPFERALIRRELPMVAVPEVSDDPALYPYALADAGYFESLVVTDEDRERSSQYQGNTQREALRESATDMDSYLRSLEMKLIWSRFDQIGLQRTVQLINKTNQFNLMTRRYTDTDVQSIMSDPRAVGLQLRLTDRFGDNGIIGIVIGRLQDDGAMLIDTWLMSCRVLGRQVEQATLNLVAQTARSMGARSLIGEYAPTPKNRMVEKHYQKLGFETAEVDENGASRSVLDLGQFSERPIFITTVEG